MTVFNGTLEYEQFVGTGIGDQNVLIRPPAGRKWIIHEIDVMQADGVNHSMTLLRSDGTLSHPINVHTGLATTVHSLMVGSTANAANDDVEGPLFATHDVYLIMYSAAAWTDGADMHVQVVYEDLPGA